MSLQAFNTLAAKLDNGVLMNKDKIQLARLGNLQEVKNAYQPQVQKLAKTVIDSLNSKRSVSSADVAKAQVALGAKVDGIAIKDGETHKAAISKIAIDSGSVSPKDTITIAQAKEMVQKEVTKVENSNSISISANNFFNEFGGDVSKSRRIIRDNWRVSGLSDIFGSSNNIAITQDGNNIYLKHNKTTISQIPINSKDIYNNPNNYASGINAGKVGIKLIITAMNKNIAKIYGNTLKNNTTLMLPNSDKFSITNVGAFDSENRKISYDISWGGSSGGRENYNFMPSFTKKVFIDIPLYFSSTNPTDNINSILNNIKTSAKNTLNETNGKYSNAMTFVGKGPNLSDYEKQRLVEQKTDGNKPYIKSAELMGDKVRMYISTGGLSTLGYSDVAIDSFTKPVNQDSAKLKRIILSALKIS